MLIRSWLPRPDLRLYVDSYWLIPHSSETGPRESRLFPLGYPCIEINFLPALETIGAGRYRQQSVFFGPMSRPRRLRFYGVGHSFLIRLHPWAAGAFLGESARCATDCLLDLEAVVGTTAADLEDWLVQAEQLPAGLVRLEEWLSKHFSATGLPDPRLTAAIGIIMADRGQLSVAEVSRRVGLSDKWLEQLFTGHVGLSPKTFIDIARFQNALHLLGRDAVPRLTDLAYAAGYYDQAHFNRHFRRFTQDKPGVLARQLQSPELQAAFRNSNLYNFSR